MSMSRGWWAHSAARASLGRPLEASPGPARQLLHLLIALCLTMGHSVDILTHQAHKLLGGRHCGCDQEEQLPRLTCQHHTFAKAANWCECMSGHDTDNDNCSRQQRMADKTCSVSRCWSRRLCMEIFTSCEQGHTFTFDGVVLPRDCLRSCMYSSSLSSGRLIPWCSNF